MICWILLLCSIHILFLSNHLVHGIHFRDCWLLFGGVDDVGWTHATNLGRLAIQRSLRNKYPEHTFESVAYPGTFFMSEEERELLINKTIAEGCNFIVAGSDNILNNKHKEYAREFPNISFTRFSGSHIDVDTNPLNLLEYGGSWLDPSFVAGAAAATTSNTCAGFINALETARSAWGHVTGFVLGYHWVKPYQQVHVVTMDSYYNPDAEVLAAQLLIETKGCDVIGKHTDPNDVDKYVLSLNGRAVSTTRYVDMSTFVGDTVFTSQVIDFFDYVGPSVESALLSAKAGIGGAMYMLNDNDNETDISNRPRLGQLNFDMKLSPFSSIRDAKYAEAVETAAWEHLTENNPLCGARFRFNQEPVVREGEPCPTVFTIDQIAYLDLPNTTYYDSFQDGGALCGAGQFYQYQNNLSVSCLPCPENTVYSPATQGRASNSCTRCENGTVAASGSSQCTQPATVLGDSTRQVAGAVGGAISLLIVILAIVAIVIIKKRGVRDNRCAPKQPNTKPIAVLFTDIQASTTIWANAPEAMARAVEDHHALIRQILKIHRGYEVKTIGDAFMVAHSDVTKAVSIALDIQRKLQHHDWGTGEIDEVYESMEKHHDEGDDEDELDLSLGLSAGNIVVHLPNGTTNTKKPSSSVWNGLRVRVGMAYGTCDGLKDPITLGWDYYGTLVNTAARVEAAAHGGQVLLTGPAFEALMDGQKKSSVPEASKVSQTSPRRVTLPEGVKDGFGVASAKSHGDVSLRGLSEPVELIELVPVGFEKREFPPLRLETETESDVEQDKDGNASFVGASVGGSIASAGLGSILHNIDFGDMNTEERMTRLLDIALRVAGVKKYDEKLAVSVRFSFESMQALFSLHSKQERQTVLTGLLSKWHLQPPRLPEKTIEDIGGEEVLHLLMLSVRSATVALAKRQKEIKQLNQEQMNNESFGFSEKH